MARLFTKEMAEWYEEQYRERGVHFIKGSVIIGFEPKKHKQGQGSKDGKVSTMDLWNDSPAVKPRPNCLACSSLGHQCMHLPLQGTLKAS